MSAELNTLNQLGQIEWDTPSTPHGRVRMRLEADKVERCFLNKLVRVTVPGPPARHFAAKVVGGPFHIQGSEGQDGQAFAELELQGEIEGQKLMGTVRRPRPGAIVYDLSFDDISQMLGCNGDMLLGNIAETPGVLFSLRSQSKEVLPRNVGVFGTVGSGKSNTTQVLIEEATANGWAVALIDVEGEYTRMDQPAANPAFASLLSRYCRTPRGLDLASFTVFRPANCESDRTDAQTFGLRLADFEVDVIAEILDCTPAERQALRDCVEYYINLNRSAIKLTEQEEFSALLDGSPNAKVPFTLFSLIQRARDRAPRSTEELDYSGLLNKLNQLKGGNIVDLMNEQAISPKNIVQPGRISVFDISVADDKLKSLVIADLLRKVFALKMLQQDSCPTLVIIEEAHTFVSKGDTQTMQATLNMLRTVARRGRKRWLSLVFVSQQPGHLPPEIFELCNTRIVHNVRSMHNLEALVATASDVGADTWARCPMLRPGEAVVSCPQLDHPCIVQIRPATSFRKFA